MSASNERQEPSPDFIATDPRPIYSGMIVAWTLLIILLVWLFVRYVDQVYVELLHTQTGAACDRDLLFRSWCTKFGGVYAANLEPNPWLEHPKRDVTTNYGDSLTLINPAWMTRQINEMQPEGERKIVSRLTSSKLLNPNNTPDDWEIRALEILEAHQADEIFERIRDTGEHEIFRLAKPLKVVQGCLNCHAEQGYEVGEIRGIFPSRWKPTHGS